MTTYFAKSTDLSLTTFTLCPRNKRWSTLTLVHTSVSRLTNNQVILAGISYFLVDIPTQFLLSEKRSTHLRY